MDDRRQPARHVVLVAGDQPDLVAIPVGLDAGAVEFPLDRAAAIGFQRFGDRSCGGGEHRQHRSQHLQADGRQPCLTFGEGRGRHAPQVAGQHGRPPHGGDRDVGSCGDGVGHHSLEGALTEVTEQQAAQVGGFLGRRTTEQVGDDTPARRGAAPPARLLEQGDGAVDVGDGERGF